MMKRILKSSSGASLAFVLAVAFLLLAITASILVSSAAASNQNVAYRSVNALRLYNDSVFRTLTVNLQQDDTADTLQRYIMKHVLDALDDVGPTGKFINYNKTITPITLDLEGSAEFVGRPAHGKDVVQIELEFTRSVNSAHLGDPDKDPVRIESSDRLTDWSIDDVLLERMVYINFEMTATIKSSLGASELTSRVTYSFKNGAIAFSESGEELFNSDLSRLPKAKWEVVAYD